MVYITGDKHAKFDEIFDLCRDTLNTTTDDYMIILGDAGINYDLGGEDLKLKKKLAELPITLICIHGNHEERPSLISSYKLKEYMTKERAYSKMVTEGFVSKDSIAISNDLDGEFYVEDEFPNILFPAIGKTFKLCDELYLHLGGAYSIDKYERLAATARGGKTAKWYPSEQMTKAEQEETLKRVELLSLMGTKVTILSHTCPLKYLSYAVAPMKNVNRSMEEFLNKVEETVEYDGWYCGHFHIDKRVDNIRFMYNDVIEI